MRERDTDRFCKKKNGQVYVFFISLYFVCIGKIEIKFYRRRRWSNEKRLDRSIVVIEDGNSEHVE